MYTTRPTPPLALKARLSPIKTFRRSHTKYSDGFQEYLQEINKHPRLTPEEEQRLGKLARSGDSGALNDLILCNLRLVVALARTYERTHGLPLEELVGAGNTGLLRASESYDVKKARFSTYAVWWIRREIIRCISDQGHPVRIPVKHGSKVAQMKKTVEQLRIDLYREPETWEVEQVMGLSNTAMDDIRWVSKPQMSLHDVAQGGYSIEEEIPLDEYPNYENAILDGIRDDEIQEMLSSLTKEEASVLKMFYGFGLPEGLTLDAIGKKLGIRRDQAWVIKDRAIYKLQREMHPKGLDAYV